MKKFLLLLPVMFLSVGCLTIDWPDPHGVHDTIEGFEEWRQDEVEDLVRHRVSAYYDILITEDAYEIVWTNSVCETPNGLKQYCVETDTGRFSGLTYCEAGASARMYVALPQPKEDIRNTALAHELVHAYACMNSNLSVDRDHVDPVWQWVGHELVPEIGELLDTVE